MSRIVNMTVRLCREYLAALFCVSCFPLLMHADTLEDFHNSSTELDGGEFFHSSWFGNYYLPGGSVPTSGSGMWIHHFEHGWLYVEELPSSDGWYFYDNVMGTWWFSDDDTGSWVYPTVYESNLWNTTLDYLVGSSPYRSFWDYTLSAYRYIETNLGAILDGPGGPAPYWWIEYGVIDLSLVPENGGVLTLGQLKNVAWKAKNYLDDLYVELHPSGPGTEWDWDDAYDDDSYAPYNPFDQNYMDSAYATGNNAPATLGQLKYIAQGFYQVLGQINTYNGSSYVYYNIHKALLHKGVPPQWIDTSSIYPWGDSDLVANNSAVATVGQLKLLFSFDPDFAFFYGDGYLDQLLSNLDSDGDLFNVWVEIFANADSEVFNSYSSAASWTEHSGLKDALEQIDATSAELVVITPDGEAYSVDDDLNISQLNYLY